MANPRGGEAAQGVVRVPALALGPIAATTVLSRWRKQLRLTVIVKATYGFSPKSEMLLTAPTPIVQREVHHGDNPGRTIRAASDLAPHLERPEAIFVGNAYTGPEAARRLEVRFAIGSERGVLMDKRLEVTGDRTLAASLAAPAPFQKMPVVYERAYGGIGNVDNPLGPGVDANAKVLPNVAYPEPARAREPAGFGPISASWPARKRLLKTLTRKQLEAPIAELPDDFSFEYFQSAPRDQRLRALEPRAWLVLEGLHPRHSMLHMRLPWARAAAIVYGPGVPRRPFELAADTLFVDGEAEVCAITYRASIPIAGDHLVPDLAVAAGVEVAGRALEWPIELDPNELRRLTPKTADAGDLFASTISIEDLGTTRSTQEMPPPEPALPFVVREGEPRRSDPPPPGLPLPGAPWSPRAAARVPVASSPLEGTMALDEPPPGVQAVLDGHPRGASEKKPPDPWATPAAPNPAPGTHRKFGKS